MDTDYQKVIQANIALHSKLAEHYQTCEPHFRPENVAKVEARLTALVDETGATDLLDLGCGTGFMIQIAKRHVKKIVGVDVTDAMLRRVDRSGDAQIELVTHDTGSYPAEPGRFQVVTAYSFLHHLYDVGPTLATAFRALAPGGRFYADLEPNYYFWEQIGHLNRNETFHPLVQREVESVNFKDEEIENKFHVSRETFNQAEYGKDVTGGFREEDLRKALDAAGFNRVRFHYHWFLGEGFLINNVDLAEADRFGHARIVDEALRRALPVSRCLYKYFGFTAEK